MDIQKDSWKKKHFEILCRIDEVCRQCDINMVLTGGTALRAYHDGTLSDNVTVGIDVRDAYRFIEAMEKDGTYGVRGMFNYYHFPYFEIRIYDPNTIDFNIRSHRNLGFVGLHVVIHLIQHTPDNHTVAEVWSKARRGYREYLRVTYDQDKARSRKRTILYNAVDRTTSEDKLGAMVFDRLVKRYSKKSKTVQIGRRSFPAELFDEYRTVLVEGREFKIPKDEETYFKIVYGRKWKTRNSVIFQDTPFRFRDGDHSWEEFQEYIKYLDLDEYYSNVRTIKSYGDEYKIRNRAFRHTIDIKERTHFRFVFWQKYMPIKDKLIELHEKGDMEKLEDILEPYLYELTAFSHKDLTIYFDREIFDIAKDVLRATEREDVADLIETLIPKEHLEPIRIKNYKGEYI